MSTRYTHPEFVAKWMESKTVQEVAEHFGVSKFTVERVARELRKKGVKLPTMRQNPIHEKIDVEGLNALIDAKKSA